VTLTEGSQVYCGACHQLLMIEGTGFESLEVFDYRLTLTGPGCTKLHATVLVTRVSDTRLWVADSLQGCNGDIYATLNYRHEGNVGPIKIASLNDSCAVSYDVNATLAYCPGGPRTLYIEGSGFESWETFDYTVSITGEGCSAVHATTLVTRLSESLLQVKEDLTGCTGDVFASLNYKNQEQQLSLKVSSLADNCDDFNGETHNLSVFNGAGANAALGVLSAVAVFFTVLFA
jgi:uncharacterized membrane protein YsdA (DUF1294 family)